MRLHAVLLVLVASLPSLVHASPPPLEVARNALEKGAIDDVLAALEGVALEGADRASAAQILAEASSATLAKGDASLALLFAQKALKLDARLGGALALAATSCRLGQEYTQAERYADRWIQAAPKEPTPKVLRAEIALDQGEWKRAIELVQGLDLAREAPALQERRELVVKTARSELDLREQGLSVLKALEDRKPNGPVAEGGQGGAPSLVPASKGVTLYSASWCGYCTKMRAWLKARKIAFTEHDVEKDAAAADRLAAKARRDGVALGGVPVTDVNGTLVVGFDPERVGRLVGR